MTWLSQGESALLLVRVRIQIVANDSATAEHFLQVSDNAV